MAACSFFWSPVTLSFLFCTRALHCLHSCFYIYWQNHCTVWYHKICFQNLYIFKAHSLTSLCSNSSREPFHGIKHVFQGWLFTDLVIWLGFQSLWPCMTWIFHHNNVHYSNALKNRTRKAKQGRKKPKWRMKLFKCPVFFFFSLKKK